MVVSKSLLFPISDSYQNLINFEARKLFLTIFCAENFFFDQERDGLG